MVLVCIRDIQGAVMLNGHNLGEELSKVTYDGHNICMWPYKGDKKSGFSDNLTKYPLRELLEDPEEVKKMNELVEVEFPKFIQQFGDIKKSSSPSLPSVPSFPQVSSVPSVPSVPSFPQVSSVSSVPSIPSFPSVNSLTSQLGNMSLNNAAPTHSTQVAPTLPTFGVPSVSSTPSFPSTTSSASANPFGAPSQLNVLGVGSQMTQMTQSSQVSHQNIMPSVPLVPVFQNNGQFERRTDDDDDEDDTYIRNGDLDNVKNTDPDEEEEW